MLDSQSCEQRAASDAESVDDVLARPSRPQEAEEIGLDLAQTLLQDSGLAKVSGDVSDTVVRESLALEVALLEQPGLATAPLADEANDMALASR